MSKRGKIAGLTLGGLVLVLVLVVAARGAEPRYRGRTLTSWLEQSSDTPLMETQRLVEAQEAVRAIGAAKALPTMLRLVRTKDDPVSTWMMEKTEKYRVRNLHWHSAIDRQLAGIAGFEVLGTNCAPAVGELTKLLNDKEVAFVAARCLENVGKAAEAALCRCLTNGDWRVRHLSVPALAAVTDDVEVYIGRIKPRLSDAESAVRFATVQAIAAQNEAPELAVPLLISALGDSDDHVFSQATEGLAGFGTNALSAFSALTNLATTGTDSRRRAALKAVAKLSPGEGLPILSNAVVSGSAQTMGTALRDMKAIAPELALRMLLVELHAADGRRRSTAISVASTYDVRTPGIAEALKLAAASDDPETARHALSAMRQMVRREKEKTGAVAVRFPNEPSYQGKPLGEWLNMRHDGWEFETNAVLALQAMGTNVIPALLARLTYREPVFGLDDYDVSMSGATALIAMRERAKPALPELTALMDGDNGELALRAMIATLGTGADAMSCLMEGLTNRFPSVRSEAANFLTQFGAQYPEERKRAIPLMVGLLSDPDRDVRMNATNELKEIDPQAAAKAGVK